MTLNCDLQSWKIALIDDNEDCIEVVELALGSQDISVKGFHDVEQALVYLEQNGCNILLLDITMPLINGWELQETIRQFAELDELVIIALTALDNTQDSRYAKQRGFDGYITKPFTREGLTKQISECVRVFIEKRGGSCG